MGLKMSGKNPLQQLLDFGQSFWLDQISRGLIQSGQLAGLRDHDGLRGVTSNPSIFEKAIVGSRDYDAQMQERIGEGRSMEDIYEGLAIRDIRDACDVLRPVFDESQGADGFVSFELSPMLAHDSARSLRDVRRLAGLVDRSNLLIKVPATPEGVPVIEQALYEGCNINVTLIFSLEVYDQIAETYIRALERRLKEGKPVDQIASVASFFVSRIDVLIDRVLDEKIAKAGRSSKEAQFLTSLRGKAGIASAKLVYQRFRRTFHEDRFHALKAKGARVQRPLWGSTGTKDPQYSDVMYINALIGSQTVNTMPLETAEAFRDHGTARPALTEAVGEALQALADLPKAGIDIHQVTDQLLKEGVQKFVNPFQKLLDSIQERRKELAGAGAAPPAAGGKC